MLRERLRKLGSRPLLPLLVLVTICLLAFFLTPHVHFQDFSTAYYDPSKSYQRVYSKVRQRQVQRFISQISQKPFQNQFPSNPLICVGMLTVVRPNGAIYFRNAIASLAAGLSQEERDMLYIIPFIAHTKPSDHPVWGESWLKNLADHVLTYNDSMAEYSHIKDLEQERLATGVPDREKHLFDYRYLMSACLKSNASYILMLEDDVLAADGWLQRSVTALDEIETHTTQLGLPDFFYLRLFNRQGPPAWALKKTPLFQKIALVIVPLVILIGLIFARRQLPNRDHRLALYLGCALFICLYIYLVYPWERLPINPPSHIQEMEKGQGCCFQAIIYKPNKVEQLVEYYTAQRIGFVDSLAEDLASENEETIGLRWAVEPSVMQHMGGQSSKGDNWGTDKPGDMTEAQRIFNFDFELYRARDLKREHQGYISQLQKSEQVI